MADKKIPAADRVVTTKDNTPVEVLMLHDNVEAPEPKTIRQAYEANLERIRQKAIERGDTSETKIKKAQAGLVGALKALRKIGFTDEVLDKPVDGTINFIDEKGNSRIGPIIQLMKEQKFSPRKRAVVGTYLKSIINLGKSPGTANAVTEYEKTHVGSPDGFNFEKYIRAPGATLVYPKFSDFARAIEVGISNINDKEARGVAVLKLLTGIRDEDFERIDLGKEEVTKDTVSYRLNPETKTVQIFNKGQVTSYQLGESAFQVLNELREDALKEGVTRDKLFSRQLKGLKSRHIVPKIREAFEEAGLKIREEASGKEVPFQFKMLRAGFFTIVNKEFDTETADKLLGHTVGGSTGLKHYQVKFAEEGPSRESQVADAFFSVFSKQTNKAGPRAALTTFGFPQAAKNSALVFDDVDIPEAAAQAQVRVQQEAAVTQQDEQDLDKQIESTKRQIDKKRTLNELQQELEQVKQEGRPSVDEQAKEVLGEPERPVTPYSFSRELKAGVFTQDEIDEIQKLRNTDPDEYERRLLSGLDRLKAIRKQELRSGAVASARKVGKLGVAGLTAMLLGPGKSRAAEVLLDAGIQAVTPSTPASPEAVLESASDDQLLEVLQSGEVGDLPLSSDRTIPKSKTRREIESRISQDQAYRSREAALQEARERRAMLIPTFQSPAEAEATITDSKKSFADIETRRREAVQTKSALEREYEGFLKN